MITEERPLTRVQIAIGHDQISEISISMLHAFAALFTVYLKLTLHANHEYLIAVYKLFARNYSHPFAVIKNNLPFNLSAALLYIARYLKSLVGFTAQICSASDHSLASCTE